jgi:glycosyltransferase involved in cell wall biosynthesis
MRIKLLALIEADRVTGPAKNLIEFCLRARNPRAGFPVIETSLATFHRAADAGSNPGAEGGDAPNGFVAVARKAGIEVDVILEQFRYDPRAIADLRRVIERRAPDIVETKSVKSHFLLRLAGLHRKQAWVAFHHGYTATDLKVHAYNQLDRWSLRAADRVITVCDAFARELARRGVSSDRISVLHNSIGPDYGREARAEDRRAIRSKLGIGKDEQIILSVGRLSREKAHTDLAAAFAELLQQHPRINARLILAGEGPERKPIEQAAAASGVANRVTIAGAINGLAPWYAAADLFALPSLSEGSPNVLLEAMMMELPIVATAVGGVPEIVAHERNALLVRPRDPRHMAEAIARLLEDQPLARNLAANARETALVNHSPESRLSALLEIYRQLATGKKTPAIRIEEEAAAS